MSIPSDPCVVVGVDHTLQGLAALRVAVVEAARRDVPLRAVRVRPELPSPAAYQEIDDAFHEALGGLPLGIELHRELMFPPVAAAPARRAGYERDLLVVGESGRGAWHALWSGSVSRGCLRRARCPHSSRSAGSRPSAAGGIITLTTGCAEQQHAIWVVGNGSRGRHAWADEAVPLCSAWRYWRRVPSLSGILFMA